MGKCNPCVYENTLEQPYPPKCKFCGETVTPDMELLKKLAEEYQEGLGINLKDKEKYPVEKMIYDYTISLNSFQFKVYVNKVKGMVVAKALRGPKLPWGMNRDFVGKAKCAEGDTFDVNKGADIAVQRCLSKVYRHVHNEVAALVRKFGKEVANAVNLINTDQRLRTLGEEDIEEARFEGKRDYTELSA